MHGSVAVSQIRGWYVCRTEVCVETTSVVDTHELLSFEDRELPCREGVWAASRLRGFIDIRDRSELPRHMRKWHWSWVKTVPQLEYMSDPAHRHLGRSLVFRSLKSLWREFVPKMRAGSVQFLGYCEHVRPCHTMPMNAGVWIVRTPCSVLRDWLALRPGSISSSARWGGPGYEQGEFNAHMAMDERVCLVGEMDCAPQSRIVRRTPFRTHVR